MYEVYSLSCSQLKRILINTIEKLAYEVRRKRTKLQQENGVFGSSELAMN
jgi:hypothetical protein